ELDRLWQQVRPLYVSLHSYVRWKLREKYGPDMVPERGPIPAHLLGNMWAQEWGNIYPVVAPKDADPGYDLTARLKVKGVDAKEMVRYGERFFVSLGFAPLPATFWERSLFVKPRDRELVDQWRWKVFAGEVSPANYNTAWWSLRERYQGVSPPVPRSEADFDPGAKYHVAANVPYSRYFLADILQFQFHRALCQAARQTGPLNRCSIYDDKEVGRRLEKMLAMGQSRPWPAGLEALTGQREMD